MIYLFRLLKYLFYERPRYFLFSRITKSGDHFIDKCVEELNIYGVSVHDGMIADDICDAILKELKEQFPTEQLPFENGFERFEHIDKLSEKANHHFFNELFDQIARSYVGKKCVRYKSMYEVKGFVGNSDGADDWHFDDWKKRFKVFLYLVDVDDDNCPFSIVPQSRSLNILRVFKELAYVVFFKSGSYGIYSKLEAKRFFEAYDLTPVTLSRKKGTVILVDTRNIHKGNVSLSGRQRFMLGSYYDIRD